MFFSCSSKIFQNTPKEIIVYNKFYDVSNNTIIMDQFYFVTNYMDFTLFSLPKYFSYVENDKKKVDTFYKYYLFTSNHNYGLKLDSIEKNFDFTVKKDSFLNKLVHIVYSKQDNYKYINKEVKGESLEVKYCNRKEKNNSINDTAIYLFNDKPKLSFFSLDSKKEKQFNKRLIEFTYYHNEKIESDSIPIINTLKVNVFYKIINQPNYTNQLFKMIKKFKSQIK